MTNIFHLTASLFDSQPDLDDIRRRVIASHGIDIAAVYCLHTGRSVGRFDDFVLEFAIAEELAAGADDESLDDAMVARTVASMRPTPMLNKPDRLTLERFADSYPVDILSYLENRLHGNAYLAVNRASEYLAPYLRRIDTYHRWTSLVANGVDPKPWIHWLLELDAKQNLHELTAPHFDFNRVTHKRMLVKAPMGQNLFESITKENSAAMLELFETWAFARLEEYDERDKRAAAQDRWIRGNSMTQPAYVRSWIENPQYASKKHEADAKRKAKNSAKPAGATPKKSSSKINGLLDKHQALIDSLFNPTAPAKATTPAPASPSKAKPLLGGMLFKKKESK